MELDDPGAQSELPDLIRSIRSRATRSLGERWPKMALSIFSAKLERYKLSRQGRVSPSSSRS